jgi:hypothetical protein
VIPPRVRSLGFALGALWILPGLALFPIIGVIADNSGIRSALLALCPMLLIAGLLLASAGKFVAGDIAAARTSTGPAPDPT